MTTAVMTQLFAERFGKRGHRFVDQARPVVDRHDLDAFQARLDLADLVAHALDDFARVLAKPHDNDAADRLACH